MLTTTRDQIRGCSLPQRMTVKQENKFFLTLLNIIDVGIRNLEYIIKLYFVSNYENSLISRIRLITRLLKYIA